MKYSANTSRSHLAWSGVQRCLGRSAIRGEVWWGRSGPGTWQDDQHREAGNGERPSQGQDSQGTSATANERGGCAEAFGCTQANRTAAKVRRTPTEGEERRTQKLKPTAQAAEGVWSRKKRQVRWQRQNPPAPGQARVHSILAGCQARKSIRDLFFFPPRNVSWARFKVFFLRNHCHQVLNTTTECSSRGTESISTTSNTYRPQEGIWHSSTIPPRSSHNTYNQIGLFCLTKQIPMTKRKSRWDVYENWILFFLRSLISWIKIPVQTSQEKVTFHSIRLLVMFIEEIYQTGESVNVTGFIKGPGYIVTHSSKTE